MKKCVMVLNKKSGKVKDDGLVREFYKIFKDNDYDLEIIATKRKNDGVRILESLSDDVDLVIAAGGDGTFNEVVRGNFKREKKLLLAHLPIGTVNDVGTMYGFTKNVKEDLKLLFNGVIKNVDTIMINGIPFVYVAAYGNYTNVGYDTPKDLKEKFGRLGYILFGFSEIGEKIRMNKIKYRINGVEKEGEYSFIFISNTNRIGGFNDVYKDIKLDDDKFEILLGKMKNTNEIIKSVMFYIMQNGVENVPGCEYYSASSFEVEFLDKVKYPWCVDGERLKPRGNKFVFTINKEINVLLPKTNINKLFKGN